MKKYIFITLSLFLSLTVLGQTTVNYKIGSYNIRYDNRGDVKKGNGWEQRLPVIASIIDWEDPEFFGAQEVLAHQLKDMLASLPEYEGYGIGRDDGKEKGEAAPIFYKKDKFSVLDKGTFWLSETPEVPGKGWDAALPRVCSWVRLEDKDSGLRSWVFNLHQDHVGIIAREESSKQVIRTIKEMVKPDEVAFLMGDFNVDQNNKIYSIIQDSGIVFDSFEEAPKKLAWNGTFNAFDVNLWTDSRIDHIFVTPNVEVKAYAVLTDTYRTPHKDSEDKKKGDFPAELSFKTYDSRLPSDHFPIFIKVKVKVD